MFSRTREIRTNNTVWGFGLNSGGQLGDGSLRSRSSPVQVGMSTVWTRITAGTSHSGGTRSNGTLWVWGDGSDGRLGLGHTDARRFPTQIDSLNTWSDVDFGHRHSLALQANGTLWAWGLGSSGRLGTSSTTNRSSPVQVGSLTNWVGIAAGYGHSTGLQSNGTLWAWGYGYYGQLGNGDYVSLSSPNQVGSLTTWVATSSGYHHSLGLRADGTLWAWGRGGEGQLGQGTSAVNRSSPVQVGTSTLWRTVSAGYKASLALQANGTLWAWGDGTYGVLGQESTTASRSSPVQVGSLATWRHVSARQGATAIALRSDGTLWAWGRGGSGQLGQNSNVHRSSPVQVGSSTVWSTATAGRDHIFALKRGA